jgi:Reverse gyrase
VLVFKELLGFELSTPTYYLRNITDTFDEPPGYKLDYKTLIKYINTFGKGGLVFVSAEKGKDTIKEIIETLNKNHIKAISYEDIKEDDIKAYENGDIDVLVGIASYRNPLARGIDLPHVIRYAVFYGVPKIEIPLSLDAKINHLVMALLSIKNIFINTEHYQTISELIEQLNRYRYVKEENDVVKNLKQKAKEFLSQRDIIEKIENSKDITLKKQNDKYYILIPDINGYIQASGRTSRLYAGGISKGLSVVLVDDKATFESLKKKLLWLGDIKFENIKDVDIQSILKAIDQDRENLRAFIKKKRY